MNASEFLKMMSQDNETHANSEQLAEVLAVMEAVLEPLPNVEIDGTKTLEGCYSFMIEYAKKNKKNDMYAMGTKKSMEVVAEYLGVSSVVTMSVKPVSKPAKLDLDAFFD